MCSRKALHHNILRAFERSTGIVQKTQKDPCNSVQDDGEKVVDIRPDPWYTNRARKGRAPEEGAAGARVMAAKSRKLFQKKEKKGLDKAWGVCYDKKRRSTRTARLARVKMANMRSIFVVFGGAKYRDLEN